MLQDQLDTAIGEQSAVPQRPPTGRLQAVWPEAFAEPGSDEDQEGAETLLRVGSRLQDRFHGDPVLVRQGKILAATFHPELSEDTRVHQEFVKMVKNGHRRK